MKPQQGSPDQPGQERGATGEAATVGASGVPLALQRLWRHASPPHSGVTTDPAAPQSARPGRPARLDVGDVVAAAVRVADGAGASGAQALTIAAVAAELRVSPMGLYRYVTSKAELLLLVQDEAAGEPPPVDLPAGQWRQGLHIWATALRQVHQAHPWLARLPVTGPPSGPRQLAWLEVALHALRATRLGPAERLAAATLVSGYVRQAALLEQDLTEGQAYADSSGSAADHWRYLPALLQPTTHPHLLTVLGELAAQAVADSTEHQDPAVGEDADFRFGLERVLDGVAAVT